MTNPINILNEYIRECIYFDRLGLVNTNIKIDHDFDNNLPDLCYIYKILLDHIGNRMCYLLNTGSSITIPSIKKGNSISRFFNIGKKYGKFPVLKHSIPMFDDIFEIFKNYNNYIVSPGSTEEDSKKPTPLFIAYKPNIMYYDWEKYKPAYISWKTTLDLTIDHGRSTDFKHYIPTSYLNIVLPPELEFQILSTKIPNTELINMLAILVQIINSFNKEF